MQMCLLILMIATALPLSERTRKQIIPHTHTYTHMRHIYAQECIKLDLHLLACACVCVCVRGCVHTQLRAHEIFTFTCRFMFAYFAAEPS